MSKAEKLITKFASTRGLFPWSDLVAMLTALGFDIEQGSGSRVRFVKDGLVIKLHKPHPGNEIKAYAVKQVQQTLKSEGLL